MRLVTCLLVVFVAASFASDPRLAVMTGDARLLLKDYNEIWAYPGTMEKYEFATITSVAAEEPEDQYGSWQLGWFGAVKEMGGSMWGATHNHNGYMLEGLYHGGNFGLIVGIDYASTPGDTIVPSTDETAFGAAFGTELELFGDYTDLAVGASYESVTITVGEEESSNTNLMAGASVRGHNDGLVNLFPIISAGFDQNDVQDSLSTTSINVDFGAGSNTMLAEKTLFVGGLFMGVTNISYSVDEGEAPDSWMGINILDFKGAIEQQLFNWMYLRAGGRSVTSYSKQGDADATIGTSVSSRFGIGFEIGNFNLDAGISDNFLHAGPYIVGGEANGFMSDLSCTYSF